MALTTMYDGQVNTPVTTLSSAFVYTDTTMSVEAPADLPTAPNIVTVGEGQTAGTFKYTGKTETTLTGVEYVEGYQGTWSAGELVARRITAYDLNTLIDNINTIDGDYVSHALTTAENDFLIGDSTTGKFVKATLAETKTALGTDGLRSFWLDFFHGCYQPSTNGSPASVFQYELSASKIYVNAFQFAKDVDQAIQALWMPPANFTGKYKAQFFWSTSGTGNAIWGVQTRTMADGATIDGSWDAGVTVTDTANDSLDSCMSPETTLTTITGYAAGQPVWFQFYRNGSSASDTIESSIYLIGIKITYEINNLDG